MTARGPGRRAPRAARVGAGALVAALGIPLPVLTWPRSSSPPQVNAAVTLAQAVASYPSSVTSPVHRLHRRVTALALVASAVDATPRVLVLRYGSGRWGVTQSFPGPAGMVLPRGHFSAQSHSAPTWIVPFSLGRAGTAFAVYDVGVSGWGGFLIGARGGGFRIVPVAGYGTRLLPYPEFRSSADVTTSVDACVPDCARGRWTTRHYRYDATSSSFVQAGQPVPGPPAKPYPAPPAR